MGSRFTATSHLTPQPNSGADIDGATVGTGYDQLIDSGMITLGSASLNLTLGIYSPTGSEIFTLIDNQGGNAINGVFGNVNGGDASEGSLVNLGSASYHLTYAGGPNHDDVMLIGTSAPVGVPGDYNGNGVVDAADYVLWRAGGPLQNEVDMPGVVNAQDYVEWRARFGNTSGSGSSVLNGASAVPEPVSAILGTIALIGLLAVSRAGAIDPDQMEEATLLEGGV